MKKITETAARALYKADETINPRLIDPSFDVLRGKTAAGWIVGKKIEPVLKRRQVAELIGLSLKSVDRYCRAGVLVRVKGLGGRYIGITSASVRKFTEEQLSK